MRIIAQLRRVLSGGGRMKFANLVVEITRSLETRNLCAYVVQCAADGERRGTNILRRCSIRLIETAKSRVHDRLPGVGRIQFDVKASPDLIRQHRERSRNAN